MKWLIVVFLLCLAACNTGPLTQLSVSENAFTEKQSKDLSDLLKELWAYTYYNDSCSQIRGALDNNATINSLERGYNLEPYFIYDEFIQIINVSSRFNSSETTERFILQSIIDLWKTEATVTQIEAIIVKIRKCYPQFA